MPSRPWYKWFPGDYLVDTPGLSLEQHGLYRILLDTLWISGPLPKDLREMSKRSRTDVRLLLRIFPTIESYFFDIGDAWDHPKIAEQRAQVAETIEKRRAAGRKGGKAKALASAREPILASATLRARDQIQKDLNTPPPSSELPVGTSRARAWAHEDAPAAGLTPAQREEALAAQAVLDARRNGEPVVPAVAHCIARLSPQLKSALARGNSEKDGNSESGFEEEGT